MVSELRAEKIIFGNELKVTQIYNLAKLTGVEVIDRIQLILEIFVRRASTKEAKLQIELARLRYELTHAKEKVRLAKMGEQPGFLGLGKYEVDVYYESVKRQMHVIQRKLEEVRKTRLLHRNRRFKWGFPAVSLAGYTNSGKSTLFNALTSENVPVDSEVFTTLSTTTRVIDVDGEKMFITDTVGFIDHLPIMLIEAFRSTLEETIFSDLILLVVDVSESLHEVLRKLSISLETIKEVGAVGIPIIVALNKIDLISPEDLSEKINYLGKFYSLRFVPISALYKINLEALRKMMKEVLETCMELSFTMPINQESMSFISWIFNNAKVHKIAYGNDFVEMSLNAPPPLIAKIRNRVEMMGGKIV